MNDSFSPGFPYTRCGSWIPSFFAIRRPACMYLLPTIAYFPSSPRHQYHNGSDPCLLLPMEWATRITLSVAFFIYFQFFNLLCFLT